MIAPSPVVLTVADLPEGAAGALLGHYGLRLAPVAPGAAIPGSFWGAPEAGLVGRDLHLRPDTPVHSMLHEASHFVCMDEARRRALHTDAGGDDPEEEAVCYLQVVLGGLLEGCGRDRLTRDMDAWGYSFRLGSTRAWLEHDSAGARRWLVERGVVDPAGAPTWRLRGGARPG